MTQLTQHTFRPWYSDKDGQCVRASDYDWKEPLRWNLAQHLSDEPIPRILLDCDPFVDYDGIIVDECGHRLFSYIDINASATDGSNGSTFAELHADLFRLIDSTPNLIWPVTTRHPSNVQRMWLSKSVEAVRRTESSELHDKIAHRSNTILAVQCSDQNEVDAMVPELFKCHDLVPELWLRLDPMTGPADLADALRCPLCLCSPGKLLQCRPGDCVRLLGRVIIAGDVGPDAKPCNVEWIRSLVRQCDYAGVEWELEKLGSHVIDTVSFTKPQWPPGTRMSCSSHDPMRWKIELKDPNGADPSEWPQDLRGHATPTTN